MEFLEQMGALMYYELEKPDDIQFEDLPEDIRKGWALRATSALIALDKLNKKVIDTPKEKYGDKPKRIDKIKAVITDLHKGINFKKLNIATNYPIDELANRLEEVWTSNSTK